ncbi:MAG TPA: hypothetical protein VKM55_27620 [Candidatus Lokiarchaeia archaeon]|nr:hypothetical protein [Candidatus Lokiarchaeia archaeon]
MSLDDIDIDSWGKKKEKVELTKDQKPREPKDKTSKPPRPKTPVPEKQAKTPWAPKPRKSVILDDVPIDALRGLYYLVIERADKKLSKMELKRTLQEVLSSRDKFDKLQQNIIDLVFS